MDDSDFTTFRLAVVVDVDVVVVVEPRFRVGKLRAVLIFCRKACVQEIGARRRIVINNSASAKPTLESNKDRPAAEMALLLASKSVPIMESSIER